MFGLVGNGSFRQVVMHESGGGEFYYIVLGWGQPTAEQLAGQVEYRACGNNTTAVILAAAAAAASCYVWRACQH